MELRAATAIILMCGIAASSLRPSNGSQTVSVTPIQLGRCDPRRPISTLPFIINQCGSYFLTRCLTGTSGDGITINVSDVTIDLNGFSVIGTAGTGDGIHIQAGVDRVSVFGGNIRNWGQSGIEAANSGRHHFRDLRIDDNGEWGIDVRFIALVDNCMAIGNGESGIRVQGGGVIANCIASENGSNGSGNGIAVSVVNDGAAVVAHCVARDNTGDGATAGNNGVFSACVTTGNGDDGLEPFDGHVAECCSRGNTASNYDLAGGSTISDSH